MALKIDNISYKESFIEITRDNWIVGYIESAEDEDTIQEIHFCTSKLYVGGLLIDDVWSELYIPTKKKNKEDVYILAPSVLPINSFTLDSRHAFFLSTKNVKKTIYVWGQLNAEEQNKLKGHIGDLRTKYCEHQQKPVLTVVTTVYNNAFLLEQTLQSVINQTSPEFEYIIKDAMSSDEFKQIVDKYKDYGIKVIREKDKGIYDGMDQGIRASQGKYVQILNSDDIFYDSEVISHYIQNIQHNKTDAFCSDIEIHFPDGHRMRRNANLQMLPFRSCINHTSLALKLSDYISIGGFDLSLSIAADCDLTIKLIKAGLKIKHLDILCVKFRAEGASNSGYTKRMLKENLICRYRYSRWNILGYIFTLLQYFKHQLK